MPARPFMDRSLVATLGVLGTLCTAGAILSLITMALEAATVGTPRHAVRVAGTDGLPWLVVGATTGWLGCVTTWSRLFSRLAQAIAIDTPIVDGKRSGYSTWSIVLPVTGIILLAGIGCRLGLYDPSAPYGWAREFTVILAIAAAWSIATSRRVNQLQQRLHVVYFWLGRSGFGYASGDRDARTVR